MRKDAGHDGARDTGSDGRSGDASADHDAALADSSSGSGSGSSWVPICPAGMLGLGSSSSPCIVTTCVQLQAINEGVSFYYQLGNDIDCSSTSTWNSNAGFVPLTGCAGFDGAGHVIDRLYINLPQDWNGQEGLFSTMSNSISNVGLTRADITGTDDVGALVGTSEGTITSSYATGSVAGVDGVGGLVGSASSSSSITDSYSIVVVSGIIDVGGLVGGADPSSSVTDSYASGTVSISGTCVGGLVGVTQASIITESFATGAVSGQAMGGLVGCETASCAISSSYWYDGSANGAKNCYYVFLGGGYGYSNSYYGNTGCTEVTPAEGVSYFYDVTNAPMSTWTFDASHWSVFCNGSGFPSLAWQNVSDPSQCVGAP